MADYIEGKRAIIEALRTHVPMERIFMADNLKHDGLVNDVLRKTRNLDVPVKALPRKKLDEMSGHGSHQGIIAQAKPFPYVNVTTIIEASRAHADKAGGSALVVVLDHVTDEGNFGAIARSAEAVGASGIVIPNRRAAHVTAATYKSSAGAISHVPVAQVANISNCLGRLKKEGFWAAAATESAQDSIWDANLEGLIALVVGSEGEGISRLVLENCDFQMRIPQMGDVASLNVAQAATVCLYEWLRRC